MRESVDGPDAVTAVIQPELRRYTTGEPRLPLAELPSTVKDRKYKGIFPVLANNPRLAECMADMLWTLRNEGSLPARERQIVILRMGWRCGSAHEFGINSMRAREIGISSDEIRRITMSAEASGFGPSDAVLLRLVDELYEGNAISDVTWSQLASRWSAGQLVELIAVAGMFWLVSALFNSCRPEADDTHPSGWPEGVTPVGSS